MNATHIDGKRIVSARKAADQTQAEAAQAVGVGLRTWQRWEADGACPPTPLLYKALDAYVRLYGGAS